MKKTAAALILMVIGTHAAIGGDTGRRPVELADPYILLYEGHYYLYGTRYRDGIGVLTSDDMKTWHTPDGGSRCLALSMDDSFGDHGFWAPEVYNVGGKFIMYYTADEHICAAVSDSPAGPFIQAEHAPMVAEKGIDSHLFIDDDGTPYLFWVRFNHGNEIWMAELEKDCMTVKEGTMKCCFKATQEWERILHRVNEGPEVLKHDGCYYLIYSGNDFRSKDYAVGYATATSPSGPWIKYDGNPVLHSPGALCGTGHNAMFLDRRGKLMTVFHSHHDNEHVGPRLTHITRAHFRKNPSGGPDILTFSERYKTLMQ